VSVLLDDEVGRDVHLQLVEYWPVHAVHGRHGIVALAKVHAARSQLLPHYRSALAEVIVILSSVTQVESTPSGSDGGAI
jgi:hypothetical protein